MTEGLMPQIQVENGIVVIDTGAIDVLGPEHIEYVQARRWQLFHEDGEKQLVLNMFGDLRSLNLSMTPDLFGYMEGCTTAIAWVKPPAFLDRISAKYRTILTGKFAIAIFDSKEKAIDWLREQAA